MSDLPPPNRKCEYGCLMAMVSPKISKNLVELGKIIIPDNQLFIGPPEDELGRETESHVTIFFGFTPDLTPKYINGIIDELRICLKKDVIDEMGGQYVIRAGGHSGTRPLEDDEFRSSLLSMEDKQSKWKAYAEGLSIFDTKEEYDVVKFDIKKDKTLTHLNEICKMFPNEEKFPVYHPHLTLGYVKKGSFKHKASNKNILLVFDRLKYSGQDGTKRYYNL